MEYLNKEKEGSSPRIFLLFSLHTMLIFNNFNHGKTKGNVVCMYMCVCTHMHVYVCLYVCLH